MKKKIEVGNAVYRIDGNSRTLVGYVKDIVSKVKHPDQIHSITTTANISVMMNRNAMSLSLVVVNTPSGWKSFVNPGYPRNTLFEIIT